VSSARLTSWRRDEIVTRAALAEEVHHVLADPAPRPDQGVEDEDLGVVPVFPIHPLSAYTIPLLEQQALHRATEVAPVIGRPD
jgi:hypothetical protein